MEFSDAELEALRSLVREEQEALREVKSEKARLALEREKLRMRVKVFGKILDDDEKRELSMYPKLIARQEERRECIEGRLATLRDCLPSGE